jgi:hypothetical protein
MAVALPNKETSEDKPTIHVSISPTLPTDSWIAISDGYHGLLLLFLSSGEYCNGVPLANSDGEGRSRSRNFQYVVDDLSMYEMKWEDGLAISSQCFSLVGIIGVDEIAGVACYSAM